MPVGVAKNSLSVQKTENRCHPVLSMMTIRESSKRHSYLLYYNRNNIPRQPDHSVSFVNNLVLYLLFIKVCKYSIGKSSRNIQVCNVMHWCNFLACLQTRRGCHENYQIYYYAGSMCCCVYLRVYYQRQIERCYFAWAVEKTVCEVNDNYLHLGMFILCEKTQKPSPW